MKFQKALVLSLAGVCTLASWATAQEKAPEVIYKIHDVTPVEENNKIVSCNYSLTLFNRAPQMVSNLSLNLAWLDEVVDDQIKAEKQEKVYDKDGKVSGYNGKSKTEEYTTKRISTDISIPPLASGKQISLKANIKTDRCFLLLQKPELRVLNCQYGNSRSEANAGVCKNMFRFISSDQGDYYTEFKPISYEQAKQETEQQTQKEKEELENIYTNALSSVNRISDTLKSMK